MRKGDLVTRYKYNHDVVFRIIDIKGNTAILKGECVRLSADAPLKDLKLYDVVVYEVNGTLVVHRIIGIEEPNKNHPEERYFLLKGDASEYKDRYPVKYEQMKAIYKGETIPYIGVFILFFQSTLGYIAMAIILGYCIIIPLAEKELDKIIINYLISNALIKVSNNTFDTNRIKRILIRRVSCENKR